MIAEYYTKKCPACSEAENNPNIIPTIRLKFTLKKYNVNTHRYLSKVQKWGAWARGRVPAIKIKGNGKVEKYVGVNALEDLADKVTEWYEARYHKKPSISPISSNINLKNKKEVLKVG